MKIVGSISRAELEEAGITKELAQELRESGATVEFGDGPPIELRELGSFIADTLDMALDEGIAFLLARDIKKQSDE